MNVGSLKVLVVEDDPHKAYEVTECIKAFVGRHPFDCEVAGDIVSAKRAMEKCKFDAAIIDIQIPVRLGELPDPQGGGRLVKELDTNSKLNRPSYVVALSQFEDADERCDAAFAERAFAFIHYERGADDWCRRIHNFLMHVSLAQVRVQHTDEPMVAGSADLLVVCALEDPELAAVLRLPCEWVEAAAPNDCITCYQGIVKALSGDRLIIAAAAMEPGMSAAAALASRLIAQYSPRYLAMTGISGGMRGQCELGDIVVAETVWDYTNGKHAVFNDKPAFRPSPRIIDIDALVISQLKRIAKAPGLLDKTQKAWPATKPKTALSARFGPMFTGTAVIADPDVSGALADMQRKLVGIEMEAYGVLCAAKFSGGSVPTTFILKSVSDFADDEKDDDWQAYASYTSATLMHEWSLRFL
jgi:nucleoside phosphorylase